MLDYQIGGNAVNPNTSEAIADIPMNRSLFVQKLTSDDALVPEMVYGLKTIDEVFEHYKPQVEVELTQKDGSSKIGEFNFKNLGDFKPSSLIGQNNYLQELQSEKDEYLKIMKQLKSNKMLQKVLENPDLKNAFLSTLNALVNELSENK